MCTCEWNPNNNPALAGTPQKAAHCFGFENSTVDEGSFGDLAVASHEAIDLVGYKSLEICLFLGVIGLVCTLLVVAYNLTHRFQTESQYFNHLVLLVQQARSQTNPMPRMSRGPALWVHFPCWLRGMILLPGLGDQSM